MNKEAEFKTHQLSMQFSTNTSNLDKGFRSVKIKQHASTLAKRNVAMRLGKP